MARFQTRSFSSPYPSMNKPPYLTPLSLIVNRRFHFTFVGWKSSAYFMKVLSREESTDVDEVISMSAKYGHGISDVKDWILSKLPLGPAFYPKMADLSSSKIRTEYEEQKRVVSELQERLRDAENRLLEGESLRKKLHNTILDRKAVKLLATASRLDFGIKHNILRRLASYGCKITVVPSTWPTSETLKMKTWPAYETLKMEPDGVLFSNGPGDPSTVPYVVETVKEIIGKVAVFGICMGHRLLGRTLGGKTFKMKFGHHGGNNPVRNLRYGSVEISAQSCGITIVRLTQNHFPAE